MVDPPLLPEIAGRSVRVPVGDGEDVTMGLPWAPSWVVALGPDGRFASARTDRYEVRRVWPGGSFTDSDEIVASLRVPRASVSGAERREVENELAAFVAELADGGSVSVPDLPARKPYFRSLEYTADGRLLLHLPMPTRREGDEWVEPMAWDVFGARGGYQGRLRLPAEHDLLALDGDVLWALYRDPLGVESIRRYRVGR